MSTEIKQLFKKTLGKSFHLKKKMIPNEHSNVMTKSNGNIILDNNSPRKLKFIYHGALNFFSEWITDDLLYQLSSDPEISAWMQRPDGASILDRMKTNPKEVVASMGANDKDVIQKISGILGKILF